MKPRLAVFTVKKFAHVEGRYWTYGGFGDYVRALLPHFSTVTLACHPRRRQEVPAGWYPLEASNLEYAWLPLYEREDECLRKLPLMLARARAIVARADIVNPRVPDYSGLCGGFWARRLGRPMFVNLIDDWHSAARSPSTRLRGVARQALRAHLALYCRLERSLCERELLFAQGDQALRLYAANPRARLTVSASHALADIVQARDTCVGSHEIQVLTVGRLLRHKGHLDLIVALRLLNDGDPAGRFALRIAGEGPLLAECLRHAGEQGVADRVAFPGQLDRGAVFGAFDGADLFCLASHSEGTPKVLLEAMARGTPVVATAVGGVSTVVRHEVTGLLVPPHDPPALAAAIARLVADDGLRRRCIAGGLAMAREHTVEAEWGRMLDVVRAEYPRLWK